jgi:tetratricopeptide (TPR) repeat protein
MPDSLEAMSHYSNNVAWAADASLNLCDLAAAENYRRETLRLAEEVARSDPSNEMRERLAYARRGMAGVLLARGQLEAAGSEFGQSLDLLEELNARDPANRVYAKERAATALKIAGLLPATGQLESAVAAVASAGTFFEPAPEPGQAAARERYEYLDYALTAAEVWRRAGDAQRSERYLDQALALLRSFGSVSEWGDFQLTDVAGLLAYRRWLVLGEGGAFLSPPELASLSRSYEAGNGCADADLAARLSVMQGATERAEERVAFLWTRGYRHPGFLDFCRRHGLCEG